MVRVSGDLGQHAAWIAEYADLGFDEIYLHHVGAGAARASSTRSASTCCRSWTSRRRSRRWRCEDHRHRPTSGGRTPSSTAWTSRRSWTGTATACGDFAGLAQRIDHLADLGVTCLWLMPFYPTAERDDGYDITDFYGVDPRLGTHGDLVEVIRTAKDRGMRVIVDLVVNHTSTKHPWFRSAERSKDSPFRDFYVWRSDPPPDTKKEVVFPDQEYEHLDAVGADGGVVPAPLLQGAARPQRHQPAGPRRDRQGHGLLAAARPVGFRVDAVPFLLETEGSTRRRRPLPRPARVPAGAARAGRPPVRQRRSCSAR